MYAEDSFYSAGTAAILLQVCYIYWFTVILKMHPSWLGGTAVQEAMQLEYNTNRLGLWLGTQQPLTVVLTYATLFFEAFMPVLALSPYARVVTRWVAIGAMVGLHLGIASCLSIGIFPYASMVCWVLFIPGETWDWLESRFGRRGVTSEDDSANTNVMF